MMVMVTVMMVTMLTVTTIDGDDDINGDVMSMTMMVVMVTVVMMEQTPTEPARCPAPFEVLSFNVLIDLVLQPLCEQGSLVIGSIIC